MIKACRNFSKYNYRIITYKSVSKNYSTKSQVTEEEINFDFTKYGNLLGKDYDQDMEMNILSNNDFIEKGLSEANEKSIIPYLIDSYFYSAFTSCFESSGNVYAGLLYTIVPFSLLCFVNKTIHKRLCKYKLKKNIYIRDLSEELFQHVKSENTLNGFKDPRISKISKNSVYLAYVEVAIIYNRILPIWIFRGICNRLDWSTFDPYFLWISSVKESDPYFILPTSLMVILNLTILRKVFKSNKAVWVGINGLLSFVIYTQSSLFILLASTYQVISVLIKKMTSIDALKKLDIDSSDIESEISKERMMMKEKFEKVHKINNENKFNFYNKSKNETTKNIKLPK